MRDISLYREIIIEAREVFLRGQNKVKVIKINIKSRLN